jgi:uncharacterized membrane protein
MMPIRELTAAARTGLSGNWGKSIGVLLVYMLLVTGVSQIPLAGGFLQLIFAAPLVVGLHAYFLATVRGQGNPFGLLFEGFNRFGTSWCAYMLVLLIIMAWILPFAVLMALTFAFVHPDPAMFPPYTIWALQAVLMLSMSFFLILLQMRYYLVLYIVADDSSVRAREAVRRSVELMSGNYWRLALLWLRFIGWQLLCVLTLGIGFIWLAPYMSAAITAFYDDLSANG